MNEGENYTLCIPHQYKTIFSYVEDEGKTSNTSCKFSIFEIISSTFTLPTMHIRKHQRKKVVAYNYYGKRLCLI